MKFTILLTLIATLNVSAALYSQDARLNLTVKDKTLKEVIRLIEDQSNFRFFFSDDYLDLNKKVTFSAYNKNINEVLTNLLVDGTVTYKVLENNVVVITPTSAQQLKVSGVVTDEVTGEMLPGVNVMVKGTTKGVSTDIDGKYTIEIANGDVLVFTYMGYIAKEVVVSGQSIVNVALAPDVKALDEVVVVGYGVMKRSDLTGAVSSIKSKEINENKSANVLQVMQGKVSGLDITQTNGQAGGAVKINLRGNRSIIASNDPLILVDGVEYGNTLDINPSDIESIEVLKDASSTAIYGTKGANGVIIITTKRGQKGATKVTFNTFLSKNTPTYIPKIMTGSQYVQKRVETIVADAEYTAYNTQRANYGNNGLVTWNQVTNPQPWSVFGTVTAQQLMNASGYTEPYQLITSDPTALALLDSGVSVNYLDKIFRDSYTQNYELGVTSGTEKTAMNLSLGLMDDNGLLRNDEMKRYNVKFGIDHQLYKNVKIGANVLFTHKKYLKRDNGIFNQALKTGPIAQLYTDSTNTQYRQYPDLEFTKNQPNPMLDEVAGVYENEIIDNRIFGSTYVSLQIMKGLIFKSNLGIDVKNIRNGLYQGPTCLRRLGLGTALTQVDNTKFWSYTWDNTLNFNKNFGLHDVSVLLGNSFFANSNEFYSMVGIGQQTNATEFYDWTPFASTVSKSTYTAQQMMSFFGRINYKFNEKYLFQVSLRADGSSTVRDQWGYFPSASVGWRINQENFLKDIQWLSNLKLRLSWGISGNSAVNPYATITQVSTTPIYYTFDANTYSSLFPYQMGNKDLRWETTNTSDLGFDFGFFKSRVTGSIDLYIAKTTDLLFYQNLPPSQVYPQIIRNVGSTENRGIEIYLNTLNFTTKKFEWTTDWSYASNRDEITSLSTGTNQLIYDGNKIFKVGEPVFSYYDYKSEGILQVSDLQKEYEYVQSQATNIPIERGKVPMIANRLMPGDVKLYDAPTHALLDSTTGNISYEGDGVYDEKDKVTYNMSPKFTFGITNNFSFNSSFGTFGLSVMVYGRIGQYVQYGLYQSYKSAILYVENGPYVNAWTPTNTGAEYPRYYSNGNGTSSFNQSLTYVNGSFVKIKDITLSYSLPKDLISKIKISNLKLYATGKNLFTFSKIDNFDPEAGGSLSFPLAKQYILGLNVEF